MNDTTFTITNSGYGAVLEASRLRVLGGAVRPAKELSTVNLC